MKKRLFFLFLLCFAFSVNIFANESSVYYLHSTLQETSPGSGVYIIQGTDGQWYQVNGQEDLGSAEFIQLPGPPGWEDVADGLAEMVDKMNGIDSTLADRWMLTGTDNEFVPTVDVNSSDVPVWMPSVTGSGTYLYVRVSDEGNVGVYRTLISDKSKFSVKIIDSYALYKDYMCKLAYSFNGCSVWENVSGFTGFKPWLHDSGYECGIRKSRSFQFWSNSASVGSKMKASLGDASAIVGKYPKDFPDGVANVNVESVFTQPEEEVKQEIEDGIVPGDVVVTHYVNVKVTNFDELVAKLGKLESFGSDPSSWFKYLEDNSLWEEEEEVVNFNSFIDKSIIALGIKDEQTYAVVGYGDDIAIYAEDDIETESVSVMVYPIQVVYRFVSAVRDVRRDGQFNFPEIEVGGTVLLAETSFNFYDSIASSGMQPLYDMYLIVVNGMLTLRLVYLARERVGQFMEGSKGGTA